MLNVPMKISAFEHAGLKAMMIPNLKNLVL